MQGVVKQQRLHTICEEDFQQRSNRGVPSTVATWITGKQEQSASPLLPGQWLKAKRRTIVNRGLEAERVAEAVETLQLRYWSFESYLFSDSDQSDHGEACSPKHTSRFGPVIPWFGNRSAQPRFGEVLDETRRPSRPSGRQIALIALTILSRLLQPPPQRNHGPGDRRATYLITMGSLRRVFGYCCRWILINHPHQIAPDFACEH